MQRFKRPTKPADFEAKVGASRQQILDHYSAPGVPGSHAKIEFAAKWSDFKTYFAEAQSGKCGYCEVVVTSTQDGDVEHFYPKGEIWALKPDPTTWGTEANWSSRPKGREKEVLCDAGYWWMAYEWSNYLLACSICNQSWKLSYFPVQDDPRKKPPTSTDSEHVLLLNPFDEDKDPVEHLRFDQFGQIQTKDGSSYGFETIRTCGLQREGLRRSREEKAKRAHQLISELISASETDKIIEILQDFRSLGNEKYVHSGMVRSIFEDLSGMKWDDLAKILGPET